MPIDSEQKKLFESWNLTKRDFPRDSCVHDLFEAQVRRTPNRVAVVAVDQTVTYEQLDSLAEQLAHVIRSRGVRPDKLVGICLPRTLDLVVSVLAVLKAGAAYVPLDPDYPPDRTAYVLKDSNAALIITQRALLPVLSSASCECLFVRERGQTRSPIPPIRPSSENLAYVMYTSGSTGEPKGVQISHRSLVNFLYSMSHTPGFSQDDVLLSVTTLAFDISTLEIFLPLIMGGTVVLASRDVATDGVALIREIERNKITILQGTPSTWRLMLRAGWTGAPHLKAFCGGETMTSDLAEALLPRCAALWNLYGPTETTVWSTCTRITSASHIHIGRPIDNTEIYIVDGALEHVDIEEEGELLIGGEGLARGYLNRPELTSQRFIPSPFQPGTRVYRTGDRARFQKDGTVQWLGRGDSQVKIRGYRIELGDIESQLSHHPNVAAAVVVVQDDGTSEKRLEAYVVPKEENSITGSLLREHLRGQLPAYMIPARFTVLPSFPLTPNGKIDRKALRLARGSPHPQPLREEVRSGMEQRMLEIFEEVLNLPVPSIDDSFFDLGGHSLLAAILVQRIEVTWGKYLSVSRLFQASTPRALAAAIEQQREQTESSECLVTLQRREGKPNLYLVHGAGGNVLLYRELVAALGDEISIHGFQSKGLDGKSEPYSQIEHMAARYIAELRTFQPAGPYYLAGYCMGGSIVYEMARLLRTQGDSVGLVALLDTYNFSTAKATSGLSLVRQKLQFHFENLITLQPGDLLGYLSEKIRMTRELGIGLLQNQLKKIRGRSDGQAPLTYQYIQDVNEHAALAFKPQPLPGSLTIFRPRKQYDFLSDPNMGWSDLAKDQLEIVELPLNPHAMLIAPFAKSLAAILNERIRTHFDQHRSEDEIEVEGF